MGNAGSFCTVREAGRVPAVLLRGPCARRTESALALAAGCGDNHRRDLVLVIETRVANRTVAAAERIGARCEVLDAAGQPALDPKGDPLTDSVQFVIQYESNDAFATDAEGQTIAAGAGSAPARTPSRAVRLSAVLTTLVTRTRLTQREFVIASGIFRPELRAPARIELRLPAFSECSHTFWGTGGHRGVSCGAPQHTD